MITDNYTTSPAERNTGRRRRRDGKLWIPFRELEQRHNNLVQESTTALQNQRDEIRRLGQQILALSRQNVRYARMLALIIDSLDPADQESLLEEEALVEAHAVWTRWQWRQERAAGVQ
jgi:hypothetical protein